MPDWLDLEKLAAKIYAELEPRSEVEHNVKLRGVLSQSPRQADVVLRSPDGEALAVVDSKDWKNKVDVSDVGAFASLVEDVEATQGVMICNRGYSKAAASLARFKGIELCQLHDVESRKWQLDVLMPVLRKRATPTLMEIGILARFEQGDSLPTGANPMEFRSTDTGQRADPAEMFASAWNQGLLPVGITDGELICDLNGFAVVTLQGAVRPGTIHVEAGVKVSAFLGHLTPQQTRGIVDYESGAYTTARLDAGKTLDQEPAGGWRDIGRGDDLAIHPKATVLEVVDLDGLEARVAGGAQWVARVG